MPLFNISFQEPGLGSHAAHRAHSTSLAENKFIGKKEESCPVLDKTFFQVIKSDGQLLHIEIEIEIEISYLQMALYNLFFIFFYCGEDTT